ncbi:hypothetical protein EVAR_54966_1 [Eumeta japonica]|uniref:Uncharacterized protein n=1 Tax=Eumeta variegata TaxID=151549 RepID=A0A4C1YNQ7_EUMVA|nr:hypothetical protein EVAR_54966_1 [Eumeta japonica]
MRRKVNHRNSQLLREMQQVCILREYAITPLEPTRKLGDWYPREGRRNRGRQSKRWEDELELTAGPKWRRVARDRVQWKLLEEAFAKRHTELRDIL